MLCREAPLFLEELPGLVPLGGHEDTRAKPIPSNILSLSALGLTRLVKRLVGLWQSTERDSTGSGNLAQGKQPHVVVMATLGPGLSVCSQIPQPGMNSF